MSLDTNNSPKEPKGGGTKREHLLALSISPPLASLFLAMPLPLDLRAPCYAPLGLEILIACVREHHAFLPRLIWPPIGLSFFFR